MNKTIKINKALFSAPSKPKHAARTTQKHGARASALKKQLLRRIKEHKQAKSREMKQRERSPGKEGAEEGTESKTVETQDEFSRSMDYMSSLMSEKKAKARKDPSLAVQVSLPPALRSDSAPQSPAVKEPTIHLEIPAGGGAATLRPEGHDERKSEQEQRNKAHTRTNPKYGCLKNGRLPTYRTWKNNQTGAAPLISIVDPPKIEQPPSFRQKRLEQIKEKAKHVADISPKPPPNPPPKPPPKPRNKTLKNQVRLGRSDKEILVLIKNRKTRKSDEEAKRMLERTKIGDMKKELKDTGFLKSTSSAPPDVIRELFTARRLAGDIENDNKGAVLEGFLAADQG
jgi:hypothetical protein